MTTIKITALSQMGTTIPGPTLVPVVDMSGTPTTKKATIANIANAILSQAGNGYAYAARANLANVAGSATTVIASSQPNITSVGTLTSLTVSGATNLGPIGNVTITGGTVGQVLTTNGSNVLSWTTVAGGGNSTPAGSNTQVQFNDGGVFGGDAGLTFNKTSNDLTVAGNVITEAIQSPGNTNVSITPGTPGPAFIFTTGGALQIPGGHLLETDGDGEFELKSNSGVVISSDIANTNQHFTFGIDGVFHAPSNVALEGTRLSIGPGAANVSLVAPTVVINANSNVYVQAALTNENANGSADWVAYGTNGSDVGGWTDFGFTGYNFNDANYTVTGPGDGYLFAHAYANGAGGGNLVLATGDHGTHNDIIFATNGFATGNIFGRISDANNALELTRANSAIKFADGTIQTSAGVGSAGQLVNGDNSFVLDVDGNVVFEGTPSGNAVNRGLVWDYGANANGVNSMVRQDGGGLTVRAWTTDGGGVSGFSAPVNIVTNQDANAKTWEFDGQGNLTLPGNLIVPEGNIESATTSLAFSSAITGITTGNATVIVTLADSVFGDPVQGEVTISSVIGTTEANGVWGYEATDPNEFQLYTDATLTTPVDGTTWTTYISGGTAIGAGAYTDFTIQGGNVSIGSNDNTWVFGADGNLVLADGNSVIQSIANSSLDPVLPNVSTMVLTPDSGYNTQALVLDPTAPGHIHLRSPGANIDEPYSNIFLGGETSSFEVGYHNGAAPNLFIHSGNNTWTFDNAGNLTLPGNTFAVNYANGTAVSIGAAALGNVTFDDVTVQGANELNLSPGPDFTANLAYLQVRAGDVPSHIHFDTGNSEAYDLIVGNDSKFVQVSSTGNIIMSSYDSANNISYPMTLDTTGNLVLPQLTTISDESVIGTTLTVGAPPTVIVISGADFSAVNLTYTKDGANSLWYPAGYNPATDPYIEFTGGEYGIFDPGFGQALYVNTGTLNIPVTQWNINPPLGSVAPTAVYTYGASGPNWVFGADGYLTLPGNLVIAGNTNVFGTDSALIQSTDGLPLIAISSGANGAIATSWVEDVGNIGTSNIASVYANPIPGSGIIRIAVGQNGGPGPNLWDFNANGTTTFPGDLIGNGSSPAPSINGFNSISALTFTSPVVAYANLPAATTAGQRAFISDANLVAVGNFGNVVGNGGSNTVCVWSDGANWRIG